MEHPGVPTADERDVRKIAQTNSSALPRGQGFIDGISIEDVSRTERISFGTLLSRILKAKHLPRQASKPG
jgi:hypothetical protein